MRKESLDQSERYLTLLFDFAVAQEASDVIKAIERTAVHVRQIRFRTRRQGHHQRNRLIAEVSKTTGEMPQAQASQSEQRTACRSPCTHLNTATLDERPISVVQRNPDQGRGRPIDLRRVAQSPLHQLDHHSMGQRGQILTARMPVHVRRLRTPTPATD